MVTVEQVPFWVVSRGVGHAVASRQGHYTMTACGTWGNFEGYTKKKPGRICRKCREELADAALIAGDRNECSET